MTDDTKINGKKILLVEDDTFYANLISQKLAHAECHLSYVASGEDAIKQLEKEIPDVIVLDIILPGSMDGFAVLEKMRADDKFKNIPVIILSNLSRLQDIEKGMKLGAFRYLVKASVAPSEIVSNIASVFA